MTTAPTTKRASRIKFLILVGLAFGPILAAWLLFFQFPELLPRATTNHGVLIQPSISAEELSPALHNRGTWTLIHVLPESCEADCKELLYLSRQVAVGLGKDSTRVSRVLVADRDLPDDLGSHLLLEHEDIEIITLDAEKLDFLKTATLLDAAKLAKSGKTTGERLLFQSCLLLMDPNGNIMMRYDVSLAGKPLLEDLKHLLKLSTIG